MNERGRQLVRLVRKARKLRSSSGSEMEIRPKLGTSGGGAKPEGKTKGICCLDPQS